MYIFDVLTSKMTDRLQTFDSYFATLLHDSCFVIGEYILLPTTEKAYVNYTCINADSFTTPMDTELG